MNDQREDVKYFPVAVNEQLYAQYPSDKMAISNEKKIDIECNTEIGSKFFLYVSACAANLTAFACGLAIAWTSPVIPKLNGNVEPENNPLPIPLTLEQESWVGSLLPLGAIFGPFAAGMFIDKIGRKKTLLVSILPLIIAFDMAVFINNVNLFFLMRFLCGLSIGGIFTVLPIYVAEIAEIAVRGTLGSFLALFVCIGILCSYSIGPYVSLKVFNILCSIVPTVFVPFFLIYIPDSPYFLVSANYDNEAEDALMKLRGKSRDGIQKELLEIKDSVEQSASSKMSITDIFRSKGLNRALLLSAGLVTFQQLSGINVVIFYTQNIFAATGSAIPAEICAIITGAIHVMSTLITPILADKIGKRILLILSAIGMFVFEAILGLYFYLQGKLENVEFLFWLPIACLIGYILTYNVGFGPLPWAIMGELFPPNAKSISSTITASVCWLLAFIITKFFSDVAALIGIAGSFWIFSGCCVFAFLFVFKLLPETSGKSLKEIQDILNDK
ncbi:hypothetical protein RN001_012171 [Aquatica leii]|uniref:Major facilitator superfamily (MFS) profile domain-containing protein n=1 Tax=Aquatica leii TaxID=1421715 RepID=A0AAN7PSL6_9COLE|nr:hypothetical protein RN001_012171 [Aquatica leii]